jgi:hypothetical protein
MPGVVGGEPSWVEVQARLVLPESDGACCIPMDVKRRRVGDDMALSFLAAAGPALEAAD